MTALAWLTVGLAVLAAVLAFALACALDRIKRRDALAAELWAENTRLHTELAAPGWIVDSRGSFR